MLHTHMLALQYITLKQKVTAKHLDRYALSISASHFDAIYLKVAARSDNYTIISLAVDDNNSNMVQPMYYSPVHTQQNS